MGSSPAVANGVVYVNSYDNSVYALNAKTGGLLWKYTTGLGSESSPAVANGVVYIGSGDFNVYASWVDEASHATPVVRDNCWAAPDRQTVP